MSRITEHYSTSAFYYAKMAMKYRKDSTSKCYGKKYAQQDWEWSLRFEDLVIKAANDLMEQLEHENKIMLNFFNNWSIK